MFARSPRIVGLARSTLAFLAVLALLLAVLAPSTAVAGPGSRISGFVWADEDRDQLEDASEPYQEGVTVELVRVSDGVVVATTTTNPIGVYEFLDVADGTYQVVVTAPGAFRFPDSVGAGAHNEFARQGVPPPGEPEKGVSAPITITGAATVSFLDAGMQPVTDLTITQIPQPGECQDLADVGTPPFDTTNGGGTSTGTGAGACLLRTGDTATLQYSVALSGLPTGVSVDNVVVDFTISSSNGADMEFDGPGADNIPLGCLITGVNPPSSIETLANGDVVLHCNMGTFSNSAKQIAIPVKALNSSTDMSSFVVSAVANATNGDAGQSNTVSGPSIQVTRGPRWDIRKQERASQSTVSVQTINGTPTRGYIQEYHIVLQQSATFGNAPLTEPINFVDKLSAFPNAVILQCRADTGNVGTMTCPIGEAQGTDGFPIQLSGINYEVSATVFIIRMFIPETDVIRTLDPNWQPGQPVPTGSVPVSNDLTQTNGWTDPQGNQNNGTGFEPGWDGTTVSGNNHVDNPPLSVAPPASGPPSGGKRYFSPPEPSVSPPFVLAGGTIGGEVRLTTDAATTIINPILCDVFDISTYRLDPALLNLYQPPPGYVIEYAVGSNGTDLQTGPQNADGTWPPINTTPIQNDVNGCGTNPGPWATQQGTAAATATELATQFGANWQDRVNMVRLRPIDPTTVLGIGSTLLLRVYLTARARYNGGPHAGQSIPGNVRLPNEGGITDPTTTTGWRTNEVTVQFLPVGMDIRKTVPQSQYQPGETVQWTITPSVITGAVGETVHQVVVSDVLPSDLAYDPTCTQAALPAGVTVSYDPSTRTVTFNLGDQPIDTLPDTLATLTLCTTVSTLTPPGTTIVNRASVASPDLIRPPAPASASVVINGTGSFAVVKSVDYPLVEPGQTYTWTLEWSNTTSAISFQAPDLIDVLPFNGDGASSSLSDREQYASDFTGTHQLTGPLEQPTYSAGPNATNSVAGTWYYSTLSPATIDGNPGAASNATPEAPGGTWLTEAEIQAGAGFGAVTAVRFVSTNALAPEERVFALIPETATPTASGGQPVLDGVYVNRAVGFSQSLPTQPIQSNEPYVVMPGFTIGDRVWLDVPATGMYVDGTSQPLSGIPIEVLNSAGAVVGTATTNADGAWAVTGLPAGTYTVRIPASAFQAGGPLEQYVVGTVGSNPDLAIAETQGNKNTATADPATTGLVSSPVTFSYTRDSGGRISGGNQPTSAANDPHGLTDPLVPPGFKNMNMDLTVQATPAIELDKTGSTTTVNRAGDTITYTYLVTNVGDTVLNNVTVTDVFTAPAGPAVTVTCTGTTLQPGASMTCTSSAYTVTQADVDRGQILNSATTSGTSPGGITVTDDDTFTVTAPAAPAITLVKSADRTTASRVGDVINYSYLVTNTGNVTLNPVTVTDAFTAPAGPAVTVDCPASTLAPNASTTCTSSPYTVTQADVDNGRVVNTATASGTPPTGPAVTATDDLDIPIPPNPAITLVKSGDRTTAQVGDVINYTYVVTNTGNVTLNPVTVTDVFTAPAGPAVTVDCPVATLAPNASTTCTSSPYTVTQADVDNGGVENTATASGTPPTGPAVTATDDFNVPIPANPAMTLVKSADRTTANEPGDVINYTYVVTNTGNVTLNPVRVTDVFTAPAGPAVTVDCPVATLAPNASMTCTSSPYTVTQADADNGHVVNTATATATPPSGPDITASDDLDVPIPPNPSVEVVKSADRATADRPGDVINFTFVVTNTGNVTLNPVTLTDTFTAPAGPALTISCPASSLAANASMTCTGSPYTVTQADVDNGRVVNTATVTGTPPTGPDVTDTDDLDTPIPPDPSVEVVKVADRTTADRPGDVINYTFEVTNTGNVTLNPVRVTDVFTAPAGPALTISCPASSLGADESMICTASPYTVTQADVDNGRVVNTATVTGTPPTGPDVTDTDDLDTPIPPDPSVEVVKSADRATADRPGDVINFTFVVTNTGNVTLDPVTLTDTFTAPAGPALTISCPETSLAFNESMTCTASPYTVTQADVDNGRVGNTATVTGTPPTGPDVTDTDDLDTPIPPDPSIELVKSADRDGAEQVGDVINFTFVVTNTGNVTLNPVTVTDVFTAPAGPALTISCPETSLAFNESMTCTSSPYMVTQADVDNGRVVNTATATGTPPTGPDVTSDDDLDLPIPPIPSIAVVKSVDRDEVDRVGDVIHFTFLVTNTGNVTLDPVSVTDTLAAPAGPEVTVTCPRTALVSGESMTCTSSPYTVSQADVDHGAVRNTATARGSRRGGGSPVTSPPSTVEIPVAPPIPAAASIPITGRPLLGLAAIGLLTVLVGIAATARRRKNS